MHVYVVSCSRLEISDLGDIMADTKSNSGKKVFQDKQKPAVIKASNITATKGKIIIFDTRFSYNDGITLPLGVADAIRASLGPKGMDKMVNNNEQN